MDARHVGTCLCGAVRVTGHGEMGPVSICHCPQCLKQGAGPYMGVRFADGLDIEGDTVVWFRSSAHAERGFCRACGTILSWKMRDRDRGSANVHLFDDTNGLRVSEEIFVDTPPDWYFAERDAPRQTRAEALGELDKYLATRSGDKT